MLVCFTLNGFRNWEPVEYGNKNNDVINFLLVEMPKMILWEKRLLFTHDSSCLNVMNR